MSAELEGLEYAPHDQVDRRVQAQGLLDRALEQLHLLEVVVGQALAVAEDLLLLLDQAAGDVRVLAEQHRDPRERHAAGVVAGEHDRQDQARDLVLGQRAAVGVARLDQRLEDILVDLGVVAPRRDDLPDQLHHLHARPVAPAHRRQRQIRREETDDINAALEVVIELRELLREIVTHLLAEQAAGRGVERDLVADLEHVDHALVAPLTKTVLGLGDEAVRVGAQPGVAQRRVEEAELLLHDVGLGVVGDALAEHRRHQLVGLALADLLVLEPKVLLLRRVAGHRHADRARQAQAEDVAVHRPPALDHRHGIRAHLDRVPDHRQPTRQHRRQVGRIELERL